MGRPGSLTLQVRAGLLALAVLCGAASASGAHAQHIAVDVAPAVVRSEPRLASYLRRAMPGEVRKALAGRYKGPLRIRISDAKLMRHPGFGIIERADYLEGSVIVPGREPIPIRLTLPFDRSMSAFTPQGEAVRVQNLVQVFAQWIAKYL